jgi:hypothetical protein
MDAGDAADDVTDGEHRRVRALIAQHVADREDDASVAQPKGVAPRAAVVIAGVTKLFEAQAGDLQTDPIARAGDTPDRAPRRVVAGVVDGRAQGGFARGADLRRIDAVRRGRACECDLEDPLQIRVVVGGDGGLASGGGSPEGVPKNARRSTRRRAANAEGA